MAKFATMHRDDAPLVTAPDGSLVRPLLQAHGGSMAVFELAPGLASQPVAHHHVIELWYFLSGRGEMWRSLADHEETVEVREGICIRIEAGTGFQFRCTGDEPLRALGVTMPPWPGADEAHEVEGPWPVRLE